MNSFHETHDDGLDPSNKLQTGLLPNPGSSQITPYTDFKPFLEKKRWFILIGYAGFRYPWLSTFLHGHLHL